MTGGYQAMFENFQIKQLFADQFHERHHFTFNIAGHDYAGVYHDEKIHWFHPHPEKKLEKEHVQEIENKVHNLMKEHLQ